MEKIYYVSDICIFFLTWEWTLHVRSSLLYKRERCIHRKHHIPPPSRGVCVLLLSLSHDCMYLMVEYFSIESIFTYSAKWGSWAKFDIPSPHKNLSHCLNISYYWKLKNENTKKSCSCPKKVLVSPVNSTQNPLKKCVN